MANLHPINENSLLPSTSTFTNNWPDSFLELDFIKTEPGLEREEITFEPRIVTVTNFQAAEDEDDNDTTINDFVRATIKQEPNVENDDIDDYSPDDYQVEKSLFTVTQKRRLPWDDGEIKSMDYNENIGLMGAYEENELLTKLRNIIESDDRCFVPAWIRRYYRKLCLRQHKRKFGKPIFDDDCVADERLRRGSRRNDAQILDRYHHLICSSVPAKSNENEIVPSFQSRLAGTVQYDLFESPHTHRILHPFIYRNTKTFPPWLKVFFAIKIK